MQVGVKAASKLLCKRNQFEAVKDSALDLYTYDGKLLCKRNQFEADHFSAGERKDTWQTALQKKSV